VGIPLGEVGRDSQQLFVLERVFKNICFSDTKFPFACRMKRENAKGEKNIFKNICVHLDRV